MKNPKWTTLSPEVSRSAASLLVAMSALAVVTCAGATRAPVEAHSAASPAPSATAAKPSPSAATVGAVLSVAEPGAGVAPATQAAPLARFQAALRDAPHAGRVRILWLGDSHTAADFWPEAVRKPLQATFGTGGPGFLYLGLGVYRHGGVKISRDGRWRVEPRQPSLWMRQNDGVFGLGGIRAVPDDASSKIRVESSTDVVRGKAHWDIAFRLPTGKARFVVSVEGGEARTLDATTTAVGSISHVTFETERGAAVTISGGVGEPEIHGAIIESSEPGGIVVDNLGINGARIGTPLAWEPAQWIEQARLRNPALVVFAYGTNEAGDQVAPFRYGPQLESLVALARQAAPSADCLVMGPTDREGPGWTPMPRVREIEAVERQTAERLGCAFFSVVDAMGGDGSLKRWAELDPPLAAVDRVHLTPRGYAELGAMTAKLLLGG